MENTLPAFQKTVWAEFGSGALQCQGMSTQAPSKLMKKSCPCPVLVEENPNQDNSFWLKKTLMKWAFILSKTTFYEVIFSAFTLWWPHISPGLTFSSAESQCLTMITNQQDQVKL